MYSTFTPSHRGGCGSPLVCLHGFSDTWRLWELVLPMLERRHDVLASTLPGHAGGPELAGEVSATLIPDAVERAMDEAGFETAHIAGNSLGGLVALELAARGRARSVVAFAPAGGWASDDEAPCAFARTGCRTPTGCSSTTSAIARCSTSRSRRRSSSSGSPRPDALVALRAGGSSRCASRFAAAPTARA